MADTGPHPAVDAAGRVATVVTPAVAAGLAWHRLEPFDGVDYKLLWRSGKSVAGLLRVAPGAEVSPHAHVRSHHHLWVLEGEADMVGERVGPGSYVHIPAGVEHGITDVSPEGCTVVYLYLREEGAGSAG
jgi:uncharacterized RmlC-like cupin family protein